jgi:quinoprotein glucose dehydrogenase
MLLLAFLIGSTDWPSYGNEPSGTRYVEASEITRDNVKQLRVAWTFHTGELPNEPGTGPASNWEATPLMVDGTLFFPTPKNVIFAIEAATGKKKWEYDPEVETKFPLAGEPLVARGVAYANGTVYFATYDRRLIAIDSVTGKLVSGFGNKGVVDLNGFLGEVKSSEYTISSPPTVVNDTVIVGSCISDNQRVDSPTGAIRAFDRTTGALKWTWDPLGRKPAKFDPKRPTLPGSANVWSIMSADPEKDLLFVPTGSQAPDFYGGLRPGNNAFANSVSAIRASTGELVWSFQVVHHDLWDYDVPAQPILATVRNRPVVIALTKMGNIFVLDRASGEPVFPVEERAVAGSITKGEKASATQPFPVKPLPLVPQQLSTKDIWGIDEDARKFVLKKVEGKDFGSIYSPPSEKGTVLFPGDIGGCNWSGGSFDPKSETLFVNTNRVGTIITLIPSANLSSTRKAHPGVEISDQEGAPFGVMREWLLGPGMIPGTKPPWGTLAAVDLTTGDMRWEKPLGFIPQLAGTVGSSEFGSINLGGSLVTATQLVFIAASQDEYLRAFDSISGDVLWKAKLPAGGNAAPISYSVAGKQYVVICAGGHHALRTRYGDTVVAYALP